MEHSSLTYVQIQWVNFEMWFSKMYACFLCVNVIKKYITIYWFFFFLILIHLSLSSLISARVIKTHLPHTLSSRLELHTHKLFENYIFVTFFFISRSSHWRTIQNYMNLVCNVVFRFINSNFGDWLFAKTLILGFSRVFRGHMKCLSRQPNMAKFDTEDSRALLDLIWNMKSCLGQLNMTKFDTHFSLEKVDKTWLKRSNSSALFDLTWNMKFLLRQLNMTQLDT